MEELGGIVTIFVFLVLISIITILEYSLGVQKLKQFSQV